MAHYSTHYRWAIIFLHGPLSFWLAMEILQEAAVPKLENGRAGPSSWTIAAAAGGGRGGGPHLRDVGEHLPTSPFLPATRAQRTQFTYSVIS